MFMQSAAMALGFGSFFQYGKRKLSAMSNEEFNKLTPEALTSQLMSSINNMIPTVEQSFHQMEQMNVMILDAMAKYFEQGIQFLGRWISGGASNLASNIQNPGAAFPETVDFFSPGSPSDTTLQTILAPEPQISGDKSPAAIAASGFTPIEQYLMKWYNPDTQIGNFTSASIAELRQLLTWFSQGKLARFANLRTHILALWQQKIKDKPVTTPEQAITASGATGLTETIARNIDTLKSMIKNMPLDGLKRPNNVKRLNQFLAFAKIHNQLMQQNRKYSFVIDTSKTINARPPRLIFKT